MFKLISILCRSLMICLAFPRMFRFTSPRKSIFSKPMRATSSIGNCTIAPPSPFPLETLCSGTYLFSGSLEITTPAAWVLAWREMPSTLRARSYSLRITASSLYKAFNSAFCSIEFVSVTPGPNGISRTTRSTSA